MQQRSNKQRTNNKICNKTIMQFKHTNTYAHKHICLYYVCMVVMWLVKVHFHCLQLAGQQLKWKITTANNAKFTHSRIAKHHSFVATNYRLIKIHKKLLGKTILPIHIHRCGIPSKKCELPRKTIRGERMKVRAALAYFLQRVWLRK